MSLDSILKGMFGYELIRFIIFMHLLYKNPYTCITYMIYTISIYFYFFYSQLKIIKQIEGWRDFSFENAIWL